jgi:drug/metabolite transporter (DMT)-like permease
VRAATTVALGLSVVLFAPIAVLTWDMEAAALPWIAASAALELAYFFLLTAAYGRLDLSLVYPVSRGVLPVLVLVGATLTGSALRVRGAFGAYALVLASLSLAPAAAVAAVRETSILFAVALAAVVLRERVGAFRAAGAVLVVAGVALVATG